VTVRPLDPAVIATDREMGLDIVEKRPDS